MFESIVECKTDEQLEAACRLLRQMYPERSVADLRSQVQEMLDEGGWRMVGMFEDAQCVAAIMVHVGRRLYSGKFIRMDSMVIDEGLRGRGAGKKLVDWVVDEGKRLGCEKMMLDSYVENFDAHRFFLREGMAIRGYHINKAL